MIKSFRGLMLDGTIKTIRLSTNNGLTGYKINKLELINQNPGVESAEAVVKIYTVPQTTADAAVNFDDPTLLAVGFFRAHATHLALVDVIVFDNVIVNQDLYITAQDLENNAMNYHLELEQIRLDLSEATVATLKDMRGRE